MVWVDESKQQRDSGDIYCASHKLEQEVFDEGRSVAVSVNVASGDSPPGKHVADRAEAVRTRTTPPGRLSVRLIMPFCR